MDEMCAKENTDISLLGVRLSTISPQDTIDCIQYCITKKMFCQIATVNASFLLHAYSDDDYRKLLNTCEIVVPDGSGVSIFAQLLYGVQLMRYPGADLLIDLLTLANHNQWQVFFACRQDGLSKYRDIESVVAKQYPQIMCVGADIDIAQKDVLLRHITQIKNSQLVIANFGTPIQEKQLSVLRSYYQGVGVGVGGGLDFLTGKVRRAPYWMRYIGCEWLYRTFQQPHRIGIMFKSVVWVPILLMRERILRKK